MLVSDYIRLNEPLEGGVFAKIIRFVSVFHDLHEEDVEELPTLEITRLYNSIKNKATLTTKTKNKVGNYTLNEFNNMPFGVFIDLENYVSKDFIENIPKIAATLYNDFERYETLDINKEVQVFLNMDINDVNGAVNDYLLFRKKVFDSYSLFSDPYEHLKNEELTEEEKKEIEKQKKKDGDQWMTSLNKLCNNDITKFDKVLKMNMFLCLNQLTYLSKSDKK
jgi:hypothetical protein